MTKTLLAILPVALLLAACGNDDSRPEASNPAPERGATQNLPVEAKTSEAKIEVPQTRFIHAEPAELPDCEFTKVTLKWDASTSGTSVSVVEIYAGDAEGTPGLFAAAGITGERETGPWVRPGSVFSLRDKATGVELEKLVIGGPRCS